jgi:hypothetical protein
VSRARAAIEIPGPRIADVEELWYDRTRWAAFVDGLKHVYAVEGDYPNPGAVVKWESHSGGRGRVLERVVAYTAREGQELDVQDSQIRGRQTVRFTALEDGVRIELELEYAIKDRSALTPLVDLFFVRRAQTDSLRRTLARFARELRDQLVE